MSVDPITLSVIETYLDAVAEEMGDITMHTARSNLIKEGGDFSTALYDGQGRLVAHGRDMPAHQGLFPVLVEQAMGQLGQRGPLTGDMYLTNAEDVAGSHLNDVKLLRPIFWEGRLVAWAANLAHWPDVGGMVPGSYYGQATEIFQEGLQIPLTQVASEDGLREDLMRLLLKNVRGGQERLGDVLAQQAAVQFAERRLGELFDRYGIATFEEACEALIAYSERRMRAAIAAIPDGRYEFQDWMDNDGVTDRRVRIHVAVEVAGEEITLDLCDSDDETAGPVNSPVTQTRSAVYYAVRGVTDHTIPSNTGLFRPIRVLTRPGSVVDCSPGVPRVFCTHETATRIVDACLGALAQAVPERVPAAGCGSSFIAIAGGRDPRAHGAHYAWYEPVPGGYGARPTRDGIDGTRVHMGNTANTPIEVFERDYPLRCERYELRPDSGGPGRWRGGLGATKTVRALDTPGNAPVCTSVSDRNITEPYGLASGWSGVRGGFVLDESTPQEAPMPGECPGKTSHVLAPGQAWSIRAAGGGGWGHPHTRPAGLVLADVRAGMVSVEAAARDYGVVLKPGALEVDGEATRARRAVEPRS
jgi:N-methylhydantoinase B